MLDFMEGIAGVQFRNAEAFWQCLEAIAGERVSAKASRTLIFRFRHSAWLLRRKAMKGGCIEITASNVTELDAVTRELEAKNAVLAEQVDETKRLLQSAVEQERLKTLEKVRVRVHDIMGSRISMRAGALGGGQACAHGRHGARGRIAAGAPGGSRSGL